MTTIQPTTSQSNEAQARHVRRLIWIMIGVVLLPSGLYTLLALRTGAWQLWVAAGAVYAYLLMLVIGLQLLRRNRLVPAVYLVTHGLALGFLVFTLAIAGFGAVLGLITVLLIIAIASQTLPDRLARITMLVGIGFGVLNLLFDQFLPPYRLEVPELQTFVPAVLGGLLLIYGITAARRFATFQFSTKLLILLLVASILPTAGITLYTQQTFRTSLQQEASNKLVNNAELQASALGETLIKAAELLQTLALDEAIRTEVIAANVVYPADAAARQARLTDNDRLWHEAVQADNNEAPIVKTHLNSPISARLLEYESVYPENVEAFVTDIYGGLVAATNRTSDFYQADETWWQAAYNNGAGAIYLGQPEYDASSTSFSFVIALPIYEQRSDRLVGILRTTYQADAITDLLSALQADKTGQAYLLLPDGAVLGDGRLDPAPGNVVERLADLEIGVTEVRINDTPYFAAVAAVHSSDPEEGGTVDQLAWRVVVQQARSEVLAPLESQSRTGLLVTTLIAVIVAGLAATLSQVLVRPINRLTAAAEQVATGNLAVTAPVESGDEFGTLARTFNTMTSQLRTSIASLEEQVQARTAQLRASAEVGRAATSILDTDQLLREAVNLITDRFGFYYAAIFMLDDTAKIAVLREATGEAGQTLKERGHQLVMSDQSMVGAAMLTRQARIALDVGHGAIRFANPLLPNTRSEIALPLIAGQRVIGALDVQSTQANAFDEASAEVLQTMADQLAVALINAQTLGRAEQQARILERLNQFSRELTQATSLEQITSAVARNIPQLITIQHLSLALTTAPNQLTVYRLLRGGLATLDSGQLLEASQTIAADAVRRGETTYFSDLSALAARQPAAAGLLAEGSRSSLSVPLRVGNRTLGALNIGRHMVNGFTPDQIAQLEQAAAQLAAAVENYNLSEQTQATLQELDAANRRLIGQAWERYTRTSDTLAGEWRNGQWVAVAPNQVVSNTGRGLAVPIKVRGETIGEFSVQTDDQRVWTSDDVAFAQALIDQVGQVIENARLLEETERSAQREQQIRQITTRIRAASDVQAVLQATTTELAQSLGVSRAIMRLTLSEANTSGGQAAA